MVHRVFHRIILASQSPARRLLLETLKIHFEVLPSYLDEDLLKNQSHQENLSAAETAIKLAIAKTEFVSHHVSDPQAIIIGADQILTCEGRWFDKAVSLDDVREQLFFLQGKEHQLPTAACVMRGGEVIWQSIETPRLVMRNLSLSEIDAYIGDQGESLIGCLGGYRLESNMANFFVDVIGDITAVLGFSLRKLSPFLESLGIELYNDWDFFEGMRRGFYSPCPLKNAKKV